MYVYQSDHCIARMYLYLLVFIDAQIACLCLKYQKNGLLNGHIQNSKLTLVHAKNSLSIPFIIIFIQNRMFEKERINVKLKISIKNIFHFKWAFDNTFILSGHSLMRVSPKDNDSKRLQNKIRISVRLEIL